MQCHGVSSVYTLCYIVQSVPLQVAHWREAAEGASAQLAAAEARLASHAADASAAQQSHLQRIEELEFRLNEAEAQSSALQAKLEAAEAVAPPLRAELETERSERQRLESELHAAKQMSESTSKRLESVRRQLGMSETGAKQFIQVRHASASVVAFISL